jgi:hypothetical protein
LLFCPSGFLEKIVALYSMSTIASSLGSAAATAMRPRALSKNSGPKMAAAPVSASNSSAAPTVPTASAAPASQSMFGSVASGIGSLFGSSTAAPAATSMKPAAAAAPAAATAASTMAGGRRHKKRASRKRTSKKRVSRKRRHSRSSRKH